MQLKHSRLTNQGMKTSQENLDTQRHNLLVPTRLLKIKFTHTWYPRYKFSLTKSPHPVCTGLAAPRVNHKYNPLLFLLTISLHPVFAHIRLHWGVHVISQIQALPNHLPSSCTHGSGCTKGKSQIQALPIIPPNRLPSSCFHTHLAALRGH